MDTTQFVLALIAVALVTRWLGSRLLSYLYRRAIRDGFYGRGR